MRDLGAEVILKPGERLAQAQYGSDLVVELFAELGLPYVALNPGSSYRGLHDSFVNFKVPGAPEMVMCCHEEIAVAVAHGYARVTGKPIVAATHDVVGLQHASMAIYNAWCDRIPMIVIGGTGPMASENRRNHIDWVHTANVQGNLVRDFVKWDDQPASLQGIVESVLRGFRIATTEPSAPVYLCFDVDLQEMPLNAPMRLPDVSRFRPPAPAAPDQEALRRAAAALVSAAWPLIFADAVGRHREALPALRELAELLQAPVVSIGGFNIAGNHPLNLTRQRREAFARADVLLALDVFDLAGSLGSGISAQRDNLEFLPPGATIIDISLWDLLQHSLTSDYERLHAIDLPITADTAIALPALVDECRRAIERDSGSRGRIAARARTIADLQAAAAAQPTPPSPGRSGFLSMPYVSGTLAEVVGQAGVEWSFVNGSPLGGGWEVTSPDQMVAGGRGAGLGQAAGAAVGAALAHRGDGRLCISVIGDGDLLYTPSALWTASHLRLPLLTIVNNNRSYGNDEGHQEHIARQRGRPIENKGVGIFIENPEPSFTDLARAFDVEGFGPVSEPEDVRPVLERAVQATLQGRPVLVDVRTQRRGI